MDWSSLGGRGEGDGDQLMRGPGHHTDIWPISGQMGQCPQLDKLPAPSGGHLLPPPQNQPGASQIPRGPHSHGGPGWGVQR